MSGGRGDGGRDRHVVVIASSRDVCLHCQVAATMLDVGAIIPFFCLRLAALVAMSAGVARWPRPLSDAIGIGMSW